MGSRAVGIGQQKCLRARTGVSRARALPEQAVLDGVDQLQRVGALFYKRANAF